MEDVFSLNEAEKLTGKPASSLRRMLNAGEIGGYQVVKGKRTVWVVPRATIDHLNSRTKSGDYQKLIGKWEEDQASGYHGTKPLGERSIQANTGGMAYFWRYLKQEPSITAITAENLRIAIANVPVDHETRNCHFTQKEHMYKALCSFTKLLIREGLRSEADLFALKQVKFKRVYPAKRDSISEEQLNTLIEANKQWTSGGRDDFDRQLTHILIMIPAFAGLRREEVIDLELKNVDLNEGIIEIIDGKGHKNRTIGIMPELEKTLKAWIKFHRPRSASSRLLVQENGDPITVTVFSTRIRRISQHTDIKINPHGLRRTFATLMENRGMPWSMIQMALGHSDQRTTQSYIRSDERKMIQWMRMANTTENQIQKITPPKRERRTEPPKKYIRRNLLDI
jgi:site-specific recombinase XerD